MVLLRPALAFGGLLPQVAFVAVAVAVDRPAFGVHFDHGGGDFAQQDAVVGDHHHGSAVRRQPRLQPGRAAGVKVVGGFVQEEDVRGIGQHAGQCHAFLLPAGERAQCPSPVQAAQAQPVQRRLHPGFRGVAFPELVLRLQVSVALQFVRFRVGQPVLQTVQLGLQCAERCQCGVDRVAHGERFRQAEGLGKVAHAAVAGGGALVRGLEPGQDPEQRGFARAVFADDGHMLTGGDGKVDAGKELAVPVAVGYARKAEMFAQGVLASRCQPARRRPASSSMTPPV